MANNPDGKKEEEFVRDAFVLLQRKRKFMFHRLYDTMSAGGSSVIPPQIGDFLATFEKISLAVEVKSSINHDSMVGIPRSYVRKTQVAKMILHHRAGGVGFFIFVRGGTKSFEIHDATEVVTWYRAKGSRKKLTPPIISGSGIDELYAALIAAFNFSKKLYL